MLNVHLINQEFNDIGCGRIITGDYTDNSLSIYTENDSAFEIFDQVDVPNKVKAELSHPSQIITFQKSKILKQYIWITPQQIFVGDNLTFEFSSPISYARISPQGRYLLYVQGSKTSLIEFQNNQDGSGSRNSYPILQLCDDIPDVFCGDFREDEKFVAFTNGSILRTYCTDFQKNEKPYKNPNQLEGEYLIPEDSKIQNLCWNPDGTWLALLIDSKIKFFEKNLCERQEFELPEPGIVIKWSDDLDLLTVLSATSHFYVITTKNRVFQQKLIISLHSPENMPLTSPSFSDFPLVFSNHFTFIILSKNGFFDKIEINRSVDRDSNDIFVIDNNKLHISHWSKSLIPPPLSHVTQEFDSQITCIASRNDIAAVFTLTSLNIVSSTGNNSYPLPISSNEIVQTAAWRNDQLFFASSNRLFVFTPDFKFNEITEDNIKFISFLTPTQNIFSNNLYEVTEYKYPLNESTEISQNDQHIQFITLSKDGVLNINGVKKEDHVRSYLADGALLAYIHHDVRLHICYGSAETEHEVEALAFLLYFTPKIFSIIIQMHRGNTETQAPHIVVEAQIAELIQQGLYKDSLEICRRYIVPFSRFISLGSIDISLLLSQVPDSKLRPFISTLQIPDLSKDPESINSLQCSFILSFLSFIFRSDPTPFTLPEIDSLFNSPNTGISFETAAQYTTCVCICFILLRQAPKAVQFSCSFSDPKIIRSCIQFLLTLYDSDNLYDIALQTYNLECIGHVAFMTMQEPSTYVPFLEELKQMSEDDRRVAIDEHVGNWAQYVRHLIAMGPQNDERAMAIIQKDELYDVGLECYEPLSENWMRVARMKLNSLEQSRNNSELAAVVIKLGVPEFIVQHLKLIAQNDKLWPKVIETCRKANIPEKSDTSEKSDGLTIQEISMRLRDCLAKVNKNEQAAKISEEIGDMESAQKLWMKAHKWRNAIIAGMDKKEVCRNASLFLTGEANRHSSDVPQLRELYAEAIAQDENGQRKKKQKKLESVTKRVKDMIPSTQKIDEIIDVSKLLSEVQMNDERKEMLLAVKNQILTSWPTPDVPNDQPLPEYLQSFISTIEKEGL